MNIQKKIFYLSTSQKGGAGIAAIRVFKELKKNSDFDLKFIDSTKFFERINKVFPKKVLGSQKLYRYLKNIYNFLFFKYSLKRDENFDYYSMPFSNIKLENNQFLLEADIIHLHWVANFINWETFFKKFQNKKFVWTLHDENPFSGGCHYSMDCTQFKSGCEFCNQLAKSKKEKLVQTFFEKKYNALKYLKDDQLVVVGVSKWITTQSKSSKLLGRFKHLTINNTVDSSVFYLQNKELLRKEMNFSTTKKILLFSAQSLENKRKGFTLLLDALNLLNKKDVLLIAMGNKPKNIVQNFSFEIVFTGHIDDERMLSQYYNIADLFVNPAICDNLPNTVAEATSSGLPVVSFAVGGEVEMIENGKNGFLVEEINAKQLAFNIKNALELDFDREKISLDAHLKYGKQKIINEYLEVYRELL